MSTRHIIVGDVDPAIQYTGPWFSDQGGEDSVGNFGPPYQDTMHGTNANASFAFAFNGTQVQVYGSNNLANLSVLDPTWECFVDNISINTTAPFPVFSNNWLFCEEDSLSDGPHILTVNATVSNNQTFWFNDIQYVPSAGVPLDQAAIVIDNLDPDLESAYGKGWQAVGEAANMTVLAGSTFNFSFIGVSVGWYGFILNDPSLAPSAVTYSIDGQTPIIFGLQGNPSTTETIYNQRFFETAQLSPGSHTLKVVYEGNNNSTPLTLSYLIIQNGTQSPTTTSVSSHATSGTATTGDVVSGTSTNAPVGGVIGGVIGGLALVVFAILGILFHRRRKRTADEKVFVSKPTPFDYAPLHLSSIPNLGRISYPQTPTTLRGSAMMMYGAKGHTYHAPMSSLTSTDVSQSIEPPSTSSGVTSFLTNLRPVPLQQIISATTISSVRSPSVSMSMMPSSPIPLPSKTEREAEALAVTRHPRRGNLPLTPSSSQSNETWSSSIVLHADSGIRMPRDTTNTSILEVPPVYTPD